MENTNLVDPEVYIEKGYIDSNEDVAFKRIYEACNLFGHRYKGYQRGGTYHPYRDDVTIWFPKLYTNNSWINTISTDENTIFERPSNSREVEEHMNLHIDSNIHKRIIFAHEKDIHGSLMYRFKGEYEIDVQQSYKEKCLVWTRIAERVNTFTSKK
ncbi:hypothetical protein [Virgibacillus litoralis]|uniref:PvuRts1 I-like SET and RING associated domain-containing protein n=1 Tax=Virgibacillus litoralis TaxID=578221 RepID=A0ABS4H890_9BACI|nr:hypothetical protein [Virgibacillus litoralis]MBP1947125.1 hypothetical protein [Virgibacillus litoralis]